MRKTLPLLALLLPIIISGCDVPTITSHIVKNRTAENYTIDEQMRSDINDLDIKLFSALKLQDYGQVSDMVTDELKKKFARKLRDTLMPRLAYLLRGRSYSNHEEFYVERVQAAAPIRLSSAKDYPHTLTFNNGGQITYISSLILNGDNDDMLLTLVYVLINREWKINLMEIGQYKVGGRFPWQMYELARKYKERGDLMDALNAATIAAMCIRPCENHIIFSNDKEIRSYKDQLQKEVDSKLHFPMAVPGVGTHPQVVGIRYEYLPQGLYPAIIYQTSLNLDDTAATKRENERIHEKITDLFHGLTTNNEYILYLACNELPNGQNEVKNHRFVKKSKAYKAPDPVKPSGY